MVMLSLSRKRKGWGHIGTHGNFKEYSKKFFINWMVEPGVPNILYILKF